MRTLVNKFDSKIHFTVPKQLVSEIGEDGWVVKIPNRGTFLQSFFPGDMWVMVDGYMEDDIIIDFLRTLKEVVTDFCYRVAFGEDCGQIRDSVTFEDGDISDSNVFYDPATALRGLLVLEPNFDRLVRFVGNGQWERKPDGKGFFHFLNASGTVYCDAPEGSYLVWEREGLYRVATKEEMKKFAMM